MNLPLLAVFIALAGCKFVAVIVEAKASGISPAEVLSALLYVGFFGSPQLLWAAECAKSFSNAPQGVVAFIVAAAFFCISLYFGYLPGTKPPSWGGEAHFHVPVAFAAE